MIAAGNTSRLIFNFAQLHNISLAQSFVFPLFGAPEIFFQLRDTLYTVLGWVGDVLHLYNKGKITTEK